jgi:hypothetical protein
MRKRVAPRAIVPIVMAIAFMAVLVSDSAGLKFGMDTDLGDSSASFIGEDTEDYSGNSVAGAGDVNGDGYDDILISSYGDDDGGNSAGQTYLIFGKASGWSMDTDLSNADASFWGEDPFDNSGRPLAGAGDVNGDGYDDILIGVPSDDDGGSVAGQTYLILGKASGWSMDTDLSNADASFWGQGSGDSSGCSVAGAGDVNGDGYDDILIGARANDDWGSYSGQTYLILGKASGWSMDTNLSIVDASFFGEDAGDQSGSSVAGAGDVNGDGFDDILIGAPFEDDGGSFAGQTYLILGKASGWAMDTNLSNANASFWGEDADDRSGSSIAGAGDVNYDGYDDILIGAWWNDDGGTDAGQTYLILGKASGWTMDMDLSNADASFWGEDADDWSGVEVAGAGDINGDGYDDILIGASGDEDGGGIFAGQAYLIIGKSSGWAMDTDLSNADTSFIGEEGGDFAGSSVAGAGDVNGDGYDDILIGARQNDDGGSDAGQTYLVFYLFGDPPVWGGMPSLHAVEDVPVTYDLSAYVSDPDNPTWDLEITSVSPYVTSVNGLNVTFQFPNGVLEASVPLELTDGGFGVPATMDFIIQPVNDPPEHDIPVQQEASADELWTMDLASHVWDIDNRTEDLFLVVDSPFATVEGLNITMLFSADVYMYDLWFNISDGIDTTPAKLQFAILGPPAAPTPFIVTPGDGSVELEWRAPQYDGGSSILGYRVFRGLTTDALSQIMEVDEFTVTHTDTDVTNGVIYHYAVRAFNGLGDSVLTDVLSAKPVGSPGVPKGLVLTPGNVSVTLTWDPPDDNGGEAVKGYCILRGPTMDVKMPLVNVTETTYMDTTVENGQTYWYVLYAFTDAGDGPRTPAEEATPMGPPSPPMITIFAPRVYSVYLAWQMATDDGGSSLTAYKIYRGDSPSTLGPHDQVSPNELEYLDTDLTEGITYYYAIATVTEFTEGQLGETVSVFAYGLPSAPVGAEAMGHDELVDLYWAPPENDGGLKIYGYIIKRGTDPDDLIEHANVEVEDVTWYSDDEVTNDVTYYYSICAVTLMGVGSYTDTLEATPFDPPNEPGRIAFAKPSVTKRSVTLFWTAPTDDGGIPVTGYVIYRGPTTMRMEPIGYVGATTYTFIDEDVEKGETYWYAVVAKNEVGEGEPPYPEMVIIPMEEEESPALGGVLVLLAMLVGMAAVIRMRKGR